MSFKIPDAETFVGLLLPRRRRLRRRDVVGHRVGARCRRKSGVPERDPETEAGVRFQRRGFEAETADNGASLCPPGRAI